MRPHGWVGLGIVAGAEALLLAREPTVAGWFTPIVWTGYVLFVDGLAARLTGRSYLTTDRVEGVLVALASIGGWWLFELYNAPRFWRGADDAAGLWWRYHGLEPNLFVRRVGYDWAFATIFPGLFLTAAVLRAAVFARARVTPWRPSPRVLALAVTAGAVSVAVPLLFVSTWLVPLVWIGWTLLLEPLNYRRGRPSWLADLTRGDASRPARAPDQRSGLRRALGVLELLGGDAVDVHRPVPRLRQDLRDARARLPRLPAVHARVLRDVSLAARAARRRRADPGRPCYNPARSEPKFTEDLMKAIRVNTPGGPEVLRYEDVPEPQPKAGEATVKIDAAGINYIDVYQRSGQYKLALPLTLGLEAGGTVTAIGPNVTEVKVGDKVAYTGVAGAYAQYAAVPSARLVGLPAGLTTRQGAAAMLQGLTAHYLACSTYPLKSGDTCLVHAAAGGVGLLLCQIAKMRARASSARSPPRRRPSSRARPAPPRSSSTPGRTSKPR